MNTSVEVRSDLKRIVDQISVLANEASNKLTNGSNALEVVNELVKNSITLTFSLGMLYSLEGQTNVVNAVSTQSTRTKSNNYYNVRDNRGKFTRVSRV